MRNIRFWIIAVVLTVYSGFLMIPASASSSISVRQPARMVTGTGKVCNNEGVCVDFQLTFDPAGGPVTGSYSGVFTYHILYAGLSEIVLTETETGELTGTFSGGDGGTVSGTANFVTTNRVSVSNGVSSPQADDSGSYRPWKGVLKADGTGSGTIQCCQEYSTTGYMIGNPWTITFPAQDFKTGSSTAAPTTAPLPTVMPTSQTGEIVPTKAPQSAPASNGLPFCGSIILLPFLVLLPKMLHR
jgi:hypothetical protein